MALTSPKMGLRIWDSLSDPYDHNQLADNWSKVDFHDHTPGRGVQIPTEGLADGAITSVKMAAAIDPAGSYTMYKNLYFGQSLFIPGNAAGTYAMPTNQTGATAITATPSSLFRFDPAAHSVAGRTTMLRLFGSLSVNGVTPTGSFTFGLYPVTAISGGVLTIGSPVVQSTSITPVLNTINTVSSVDVAAPAAGYYVLGCVTTSTIAASSTVWALVHLQVRQV